MLPNSNALSLQVKIANWQDPDIAAYNIACCLGVIPRENGEFITLTSVKSTFWGANALGDSMYKILYELVACNVLEFNEENEKFRWNPNFEFH
jgi:hypothetical protein